MRRVLLGLASIMFINPVYALEDCIVSYDGTLTDIKVADEQMLEIHPVVTIFNEKNTLIVHPLKVGTTSFSVLKDGKDRAVFKVQINENETIADEVEGFDVETLDSPPEILDCDIDFPPKLRDEIEDEPPPALREGEI